MRAAQCTLGIVDIWTKRAAEGIAECEHALDAGSKSCSAHALIGLAKIFVGRAEETEAHMWRSPAPQSARHDAYIWMASRGIATSSPRQLRASGRVVSTARSRPTEIIPTHISCWPPLSRSLVDLTRRVPQSKPVSRSTRISPSPASAPSGRAKSDNPTFLAGANGSSGHAQGRGPGSGDRDPANLRRSWSPMSSATADSGRRGRPRRWIDPLTVSRASR